jgi:hypothetical protein
MIDLLPCPFCGAALDVNDHDTRYPNGTGWEEIEEVGMRTYTSFRNVPKEQWCYKIGCRCGAEMHGDGVQEVTELWNTRAR